MLQNLHVKNLALIDESEVDFGPGLNILTGETGAGKSILMGSVQLALGGKYSADMLRSGASNGLVELTFSVEDETVRKKLEMIDVFPEDGMLTLSRRLMGGRSVSRINGETVSMGTLRAAASLLIDIHGQHDNQTLLDRKNHLALLDLFSAHEIGPAKRRMADTYRSFQEVSRKLEEFSLDEESRRRELSLAEFEVNEIEEAALSDGEDEELEQHYRRMTESRRVTEAIAGTYRFTAEDSASNASDCLSRAIRAFQEISDFDENASQLYSQLLDADSLLNDFNRELSEYAKSFEFSQDEFKETEERLNLINHLKAKYGKTVKEILGYCEEKKQKIEELDNYDAYIKKLKEEKEKKLREVQTVSEELHAIRLKNSEMFVQEIKKQMQELNFLDTRIEMHMKDTGRYSANGRDDAEFYIALNPGEPLRTLAGIASGGELSRIMLAVKTVLADEEDTPTLIFDEIDSGISGITADKVGEKLRVIGRSRQVICITHLPQIAAAADVHFLIEKSAEENSVSTEIRRLNNEDSVRELARILGGSKITKNILESAREMKELAKTDR